MVIQNVINLQTNKNLSPKHNKKTINKIVCKRTFELHKKIPKQITRYALKSQIIKSDFKTHNSRLYPKHGISQISSHLNWFWISKHLVTSTQLRINLIMIKLEN